MIALKMAAAGANAATKACTIGRLEMAERNRGEELQEHHNDGQESDENRPPHDISTWDRLTQREEFVKEMEEDNEAYAEGRKNR